LLVPFICGLRGERARGTELIPFYDNANLLLKFFFHRLEVAGSA
jgi:hypothetical protein